MRLRACPVCGQSYDTKNLAEVDHHGPDAHAPLPPQG